MLFSSCLDQKKKKNKMYGVWSDIGACLDSNKKFWVHSLKLFLIFRSHSKTLEPKACSVSRFCFVLFLIFICLLIFGSAGYSLLCAFSLVTLVQASHCSGFSRCRAWAAGTQASVVVAHGVWDLSQPGINPCPLRWQAAS